MKNQANAHFTIENASSYYKIINIISFCAFFSNWISDDGQVCSRRCRLNVKDSHSKANDRTDVSNVENIFVKIEGKNFITFILFKRSSSVDFKWEPNQQTNDSMFIFGYYVFTLELNNAIVIYCRRKRSGMQIRRYAAENRYLLVDIVSMVCFRISYRFYISSSFNLLLFCWKKNIIECLYATNILLSRISHSLSQYYLYIFKYVFQHVRRGIEAKIKPKTWYQHTCGTMQTNRIYI